MAIDCTGLLSASADSPEVNMRSQKLSFNRTGETRASPGETTTCLETVWPAAAILISYCPSRSATTRHTTSLSFGTWTAGAETRQFRGQLQRRVVQCCRIIDSRFHQKTLCWLQRHPAEISIQLNDQEGDGKYRDQKRSECKSKIAARSAKDLSVGAHHHGQLVLKQADGQQVRLQPVFGAADGFLI